MNFRALAGLAPIGLLAAACSSHPMPQSKLIASESTIRGAREVGASGNPESALYLKLAQEQVEMARSYINQGENKRAEYYLMRAQADADLSLALAKEATARAQAQQASDQIRALQQGTNP